MDLVLAGAGLPGRQETVDIAIRDGRIAAVVPFGSLDMSGASPVERVDVAGRCVVPGLWDNHVHFTQWAQTARRLDVSGAGTARDAAESVRKRAVADPGDEPLIGFGFHDALWPDTPTRALLDDAAGSRPTVLIAGDLHCSWLNTAAARLFAPPTADDPGQAVLREDASFAVTTLLAAADEATLDRWALEAAAAAARRGVVGVVDLEYGWNFETWSRRFSSAGIGGPSGAVMRVEAGIYPDHLDRAIAEGLRTGEAIAGTGGMLTVGPFKVISDGSLNTRTALCAHPYPDGGHGVANLSQGELVEYLRRASVNGIEPAVHAIGDLANHVALDAFEQLGIGGRIEHAQLLSASDVQRFGPLGVTASVQPEHAMDDRDVADALWAAQADRAFPLADLVRHGARLAFGSDAPVAPLDPWIAIAAAVTRSRDGRTPWHPKQSVSRPVALHASTRSSVEPGQPADLAVLERDPLTCAPEELRGMPVAATLLAGRFTHDTLR